MEKTNRTGHRAKTATVMVLFLAAAVLSAIFMGKVAINYNLADYLGDGTETKMALDIIEEEFGMTGNMQVMVKNVSAETAEEMCERIEDIPNVLNVNFDKYDETYYKDGNALFVVIIDGDDYSEAAAQVAEDIREAFALREGVEYGGTAVEKQALREAITGEMGYILAVSLCLVVAILLITSESWLEPFVLLAASGVAVLINRGTNFFFGEISYITNSIAAILQLALSIDYSIVLLHSYRREKEKTPDRYDAMRAAVRSVIKPVSASALTTMAGLLALLFMSFRIGFDIGLVLMKGIVISAITSLTLLPALVLLFDKPMKRAGKRAFVPGGRCFCKVAFRAGKGIVPVALALVIVCGVLQSGNRFIFSDTKAGNTAISDVFGNNNSVVVVYKNTENNDEKEAALVRTLEEYRRADGSAVLAGYTAYSNTVREAYDVEKAVQKLELSEEDARMLFAMYHLYSAPSRVQMTLAEFVRYADALVGTDADAKEFADKDTEETLGMLADVSDIASGSFTADALYEKLSSGQFAQADIDLFSVRQLYGMYFYDKVPDAQVDFCEMLAFLVRASENAEVSAMFNRATVAQLETLAAGVAQFETQMEMPMDRAMFGAWLAGNTGMVLSDEQLTQIYAGYFATVGETPAETIPFLPLMKFLVGSGMMSDANLSAAVAGYDVLYAAVNASYSYEAFLPTLSRVAETLSGQTPQISATEEAIQQMYILYFYETKAMPEGSMSGKDFAGYALSAYETNSVVHQRLGEESRNKLADMLTVGIYMEDKTALTYKEMQEKLVALQGEIKSGTALSVPDAEKISGVYIKYAVSGAHALSEPIVACDLLDFVNANMEDNTLLVQKMQAENREKVTKAQEDREKAQNLLLSRTHARMLLSVNLPNESEETTDFVERLSAEVKEIFGEDACIAGEIVSTYDLEKTFDHDNLFITVFTLISIFVIVMLIFRSLSLPVILVAVIQGAIFIAMSTQLLGNGTFFMSYIVSTCILMGATIDYGILMSSNYVAHRNRYDKKEALAYSVEAAMPTVFTSGLILTVCGFVIHFISSQNSISTVGLLIGIGTICSVLMITVVLPSLLYLLDGFVLRLSIRKK